MDMCGDYELLKCSECGLFITGLETPTKKRHGDLCTCGGMLRRIVSISDRESLKTIKKVCEPRW